MADGFSPTTKKRRTGTPSTTSQTPGSSNTTGNQIKNDDGKRRTAGAHIGGQKFEMYTAALLGLRGVNGKHDFRLETNVGERTAGNMDDIIYHYDNTYYFLQLKHSENPQENKFQPSDMLDLLYKCMKSIQSTTQRMAKNDYVFIIFTNRELSRDMLKYKRCGTHVDDFILTERGQGLTFKFEYSENLYNYIKNQAKSDKKLSFSFDSDLVKKFLDKLIIATKQKGRDGLESVIIDEIKRQDSVRVSKSLYKIVFDHFMLSVEDWWERKKPMTSNSINQWLEQAKTQVFKSLVKELKEQNTPVDVKFSEQQQGTMKSSLSNSHVVQVSTQNLNMTCTKVQQALGSERCISLSDKAILRRRSEALYAWQGGLWNWLIVCWNTTVDPDLTVEVERITGEKTEKKMVFITLDNQDLCGFWKICDTFNLYQLESASMQHVLEQTLDFQGQTVYLNELIGHNQELRNSITAEHVIEMLGNERPIIGKHLEEQVEYYVPRGLQCNVFVTKDVLRDQSLTDVFAISGTDKFNLQQLIPSEEKIGRYYDSLGKGMYDGNKTERYIVLDCDFQSLCDLLGSERPLHWLNIEGNRLRWKESRAGPSLLSQYFDVGKTDGAVDWVVKHVAKLGIHSQMKNSELHPTSVWGMAERSVLIMGKTTHLTAIALDTKRDRPTNWVVRINWNEHTQFLDSVRQLGCTFGRIMDLLWKSGNESGSSLEYILFQFAENMIILLDGFDEISPTYAEIALDLVLTLLNEDKIGRLWVTSRPVMRQILEQKLDTVSFSLTPLSKKDQHTLLLQLWKLNAMSEAQTKLLDYFITEMVDSANIYLKDKHFTSIPLHLVMLAMAFETNMRTTLRKDEIDLPEAFKALDIYDKFIERKKEIYITDKNKADLSNVGTIDIYERDWEFIEKNHMRSALFVLLSEDVNSLHDKRIEHKTRNFIRRIMEGKDRTGVVVQVVEEKPYFVHRTFAEYFAARWFAKHYTKNREVLSRILCNEHYTVMRDMMDRILVGNSNLHLAVLNREEETVKFLIESGADVNCTDSGGRSALHMVVGRGVEYITTLLLDKGVSADICDNVLHWTAAHYALMAEDWEAAGALLEAQTCKHDYPQCMSRKLKQIQKKSKALYFAAVGGHIQLTELLVQHGANVNMQVTYIGGTALHIAAEDGHADLVNWLIEHGADINITNNNDDTPMDLGFRRGHLPIVQQFVKKKQKINKTDNMGCTLLHTTASLNYLPIVKFLVEEGLSLHSRDNKGATPLHYAAKKNRFETMEWLLEQEIDVNCQDNRGRTALHKAASKGNFGVLQMLLEHENIDKDKQDNNGCTPLHIAVQKNHYDIVEHMLFHRIADPNCPDNKGWTPLHYASRKGQLSTVEYCFWQANGKHTKDNEGRTPLHHAIQCSQLEVAKYLIEEVGADIKCLDNHEESALNIAEKLDNGQKKDDILEYLRSRKSIECQSSPAVSQPEDMLLD